jgi:hypothetical protein
VADEAPPLPKGRPAADRNKEASSNNSNSNSTSEWEDVWVTEAEGGPTHQLVQHLMQPLVEPEIRAEGSSCSREQRRVRFASFLPTLKQATRMPLYPPPESAHEGRDRSYASSEEEKEEVQQRAEREDVYREADECQGEYLPGYAAARQENVSRKDSAKARKSRGSFSWSKGKADPLDARDKDIELGVYPFAASSCTSSRSFPRKTGSHTRPTHLLRRRILGVLLPAGASRPVLLSLLLFLLLLTGATIGLSFGLVASQKSLRTARTALSPLESQIATLQTQAEAQAEALNEQITSLNAQVATLTSEEKDLKTQLASAKAAEASSEAALKKVAAQVSSALDAANLSSSSVSTSTSASPTTTSATTDSATANATTTTAASAR